MNIRDINVKRDLYKREDGSYYLFSEDQFNDHLYRAMEVVGAYNRLSKALVKFEDLEEKAKKKSYLLGIITEGEEYVRNEYRNTLEKELKGISFFRAKRASLIEESIDAIPSEIFDIIRKFRTEASQAGEGLGKRITAEDLTLTLADDKSCLWVGLSKKYEEDLKASLVKDVPDSEICASEKLLEAVKILRELRSEGAVLTGSYSPSGTYFPGIVEGLIVSDKEVLSIEDVVGKVFFKPKK